MIFVSIRVHSCPFVPIRGSEFFFSCISCVSWFNPFAPIRGSKSLSCPSCLSCVPTHSCPFVAIRVHSWFKQFVSIRGSEFFSCISCPFVVLFFLFVYFVCFVVQSIRAHSCPFVVLSPFRVFRVLRGSIRGSPDSFSEKIFPENVGGDLFSADLFQQLQLEIESYR